MGQAWRADKLAVSHNVGPETDLEQYSKFYWHPVKGTKQWNTANNRRCICYNLGQLILNTLKFGEVRVCNITTKGIAIIKMTRHRSRCK